MYVLSFHHLGLNKLNSIIRQIVCLIIESNKGCVV